MELNALLKEVMNGCLDTSHHVFDTMLKAKVLAYGLGNPEFKLWVTQELDGYTDVEQLPAYRVFSSEIRGNVISNAYKYDNAVIPLSTFPAELRKSLSHVFLDGGVGFYEGQLRRHSQDAILQEPLPQDLVVAVSDRVFRDHTLLSAWKRVDIGMMATVVDQVRNRLLSFALEIQALDLPLGTEDNQIESIDQRKIENIVNTYIYGSVNNLAIGSSHVQQIGIQMVVPGDLETLLGYLRAFGVPEVELDGLSQAIRHDPVPDDPTHWGQSVAAWVGQLMGKAGSTAWEVTVSVASELISEALIRYYGG